METDVKNRMYYFLDNMIIAKNLDLNKIKIGKNSYSIF